MTSTSCTLLVVDDPTAVVRRAVAAGATETSPVAIEHGWLLGRIVDPFGHEWEIGKSYRGHRPSVGSRTTTTIAWAGRRSEVFPE